MSYRGSLRQCITVAFDRLTHTEHTECSILHCEAGKYYTLIFPPDYDRYHDKVGSGELQLRLCVTLGELRSMLSHPNADLFTKVPPQDNEGNHTP